MSNRTDLNTLLNRLVDFLARINIGEAPELLNELRSVQLSGMHDSNIAQMKLYVLQAAHKNATKAVKAIEAMGALDEVEGAYEMIAFLNKMTIEETTKAEDE